MKLRGLVKVDWLFVMTAAAFNLWRIPKLQAATVDRRPARSRLAAVAEQNIRRIFRQSNY